MDLKGVAVSIRRYFPSFQKEVKVKKKNMINPSQERR
jgi:hypothetical protein